MIDDVEYLFIYSFAIYISALAFFCEVSVQVFGTFFIWVVCFLIVHKVLSIFRATALFQLSFTDVFSQSAPYLLTLLTVSFIEHSS